MKDIRLSTEFWDHPKTVKFTRRLGLEGIRSLQILWLWARVNRPEGILTGMDSEDIEIAAKWDGEPERFVNESLSVRWVDVNDGVYELHDWADHNPWSVDSIDRGDKARLSRMAKTHPELFKKLTEAGINSISSKHYNMLKKNNDSLTIVNGNLTPAPAPAPAPSLNETNNNIADSVPESANLTIEDENGQKNHGSDDKDERHDTGPENESASTGIQTLLPGIGEQGAPGEDEATRSTDRELDNGNKREDEGNSGKPSYTVGLDNEAGEKDGVPKKTVAKPFTLSEVRQMRPSWWSEEEWEDLIDLRRKKKAAQTKRAYNQLINEFEKAKERGYTADEIMNAMNSGKGWSGFKLDWMKDPPKTGIDGKKKPARTKEQIRAEVYAKYGRKDLQEASIGTNGKIAGTNLIGENAKPPGPALQILFGR